MDLSTLGTNLLIKYFKRDGSQMLLQTTWLWNHTSHTKVYVNEFVANVLPDYMGMIIFDHRGCGGWEAKNIVSRWTLWHFNSTLGLSAPKRFTKKFYQLWLSASISRILEPSPEGLISSWTILNNFKTFSPMWWHVKAYARSPGQVKQGMTCQAEGSLVMSTLGTNLLIKYVS